MVKKVLANSKADENQPHREQKSAEDVKENVSVELIRRM